MRIFAAILGVWLLVFSLLLVARTGELLPGVPIAAVASSWLALVWYAYRDQSRDAR